MIDALFIYAHLDDETILSFGTLLKFIQLGKKCRVVALCGNGRTPHMQIDRKNAFFSNLNRIGIDCTCYDNTDLHLTLDSIDQIVQQEIQKYQPRLVVTHSNTDMHFEHRMVSERTLLMCRRISNMNVERLWMAQSQASNQAYGQFGCFQPNVFVDISLFANQKISALKQYSHEIPDNEFDNRSIDSIMTSNRQFGFTCGVKHAEAYKQIFEVI